MTVKPKMTGNIMAAMLAAMLPVSCATRSPAERIVELNNRRTDLSRQIKTVEDAIMLHVRDGLSENPYETDRETIDRRHEQWLARRQEFYGKLNGLRDERKEVEKELTRVLTEQRQSAAEKRARETGNGR